MRANSSSSPHTSQIGNINTRLLAHIVSEELKRFNIPQSLFAARILHRSQGTLSDLLRNPKPWSRLKGGRETFCKMLLWLEQPLFVRINCLGRWGGSNSDHSWEASTPIREDMLRTNDSDSVRAPIRKSHKRVKKPRLVFSEIQRRTLQAIFQETQRPSREMQSAIALQLNLNVSTVANFFMNARRRSWEKYTDQTQTPHRPWHWHSHYRITSSQHQHQRPTSWNMSTNYCLPEYATTSNNLFSPLDPVCLEYSNLPILHTWPTWSCYANNAQY